MTGHLVELLAQGRTILRDGRATRVDAAALHAALRDEMRAGLPDRAPVIAAWPKIEAAIARHYTGCC